MPPVNVLIKPASSACDMGCEYCFTGMSHAIGKRISKECFHLKLWKR